MHSPAPMPNGGAGTPYGMAPMMNPGGPPQPNYAPPPPGQQPMGMRPMHEQDPMNNGSGVFMNGPTSNQPPPQFVGQQPPQQPMPNGIANPHGNMMSPHTPMGMPPMMPSPQTTPGPPGGPPPHIYNQHQGMMSPQQQQQPPPPQPQQPGMYPPQGMSPHNNMVLQQVIQNSNTQGRVMSPSQQQQTNGGMMSPHPHLMNPQQPPQQCPPMHNMVPHQQPSPQMVGPGMMPPNGPMPPGGMMPPNRMNMMPPQANNMMGGPNPHAGMMSPQQPLPPNMMPPMNHPNQHHPQQPHHGGGPMMGPPPQGGGQPQPGQMPPPGVMMAPPPPQQGGKLFQGPPNQGQPMAYNQNPNGPPIHVCGACHREIQGDVEEAIMCESGCYFWYHRTCVGLSPEAYQFLKNETMAEWVCETCFLNKRVPPVKFKS